MSDWAHRDPHRGYVPGTALLRLPHHLRTFSSTRQHVVFRPRAGRVATRIGTAAKVRASWPACARSSNGPRATAVSGPASSESTGGRSLIISRRERRRRNHLLSWFSMMASIPIDGHPNSPITHTTMIVPRVGAAIANPQQHCVSAQQPSWEAGRRKYRLTGITHGLNGCRNTMADAPSSPWPSVRRAAFTLARQLSPLMGSHIGR
jgi:hypothetical protein